MLLPGNWLATMQAQDRTFVDYLIASVLKGTPVDWRTFAVSGVSDVDDARSIELLLGGGHLTLFEREVSKGDREADLRQRIRAFLAEACEVYDLILIDLPVNWFSWTSKIIAASGGIVVTGLNSIPGLRQIAETLTTVGVTGSRDIVS